MRMNSSHFTLESFAMPESCGGGETIRLGIPKTKKGITINSTNELRELGILIIAYLREQEEAKSETSEFFTKLFEGGHNGNR